VAQDVKKVLVFVGETLADTLLAGVTSQVDVIKSIGGVTWEFDYVVRGDIQNFTDYDSYDLCFMTENPRSGEANHYGTTGVKALPTLNYKSWAIRVSKENWPWVDDETAGNWWTPVFPNTDVPAETKIEIWEDHAILDDIDVVVGGTFSLATKVELDPLDGSPNIQTFTITDSEIADNATVVAISNVAIDSGMNAMNILYAIDENPGCKKHVVLGTHQRYLEYPTAEMNQLTSGSVKWLLDLEGGTSVKDHGAADFNTRVYPNPATSTSTVQFNVEQSSTVEITVMNAVGQVMYQDADIYGPGLKYEQINVSGFASGLYFVKVRMDGLQQARKLVIE
jgi:hypothetical protein